MSETRKGGPKDEIDGFVCTLETSEHTFDRALEVADVDKVFGEPVRQGETTIIPTAEVITGFGFGFGFGRGEKPKHEGGGGGGGGGGSVFARPVAAIVASPEGVRVQPVIDVTKVALAALTAGGFMLATWLKMRTSADP